MPSVDYAGIADAYAHREVHPDVVGRLVGPITGSSRVLEVGCGTGNYLAAVTSLTECHPIGVDPEGAMLEKLRERHPSLRSCLGQAEALAFRDATFDLLYSVDVIHHIGDRPQFFWEAFRTLRPGGLVCTVTDSEEVIRSREPLAKYFPEIVEIELKRYPSMTELWTYMDAAGFHSMREDLVERTFLFTDASPIRERVFSCLGLLDDHSFERGLARLEADLTRGPVRCIWRYVLLWGTKE